MRQLGLLAMLSALPCAHAQEHPAAATHARTAPAVTVNVQLIGQTRGVAVDDDPASEQPPRLPAGSAVKICVSATRSGFITVWSTDSDGATARIYPNDYAHKDRHAVPLKQGALLCIGDGGDFRLTVTTPLGDSTVYVLWTRTEEDNLGPEAYRELGSRGDAAYAEARFIYTIVQPAAQ